MEPSDTERQAMAVLWQSRHPDNPVPTSEDEHELLSAVRNNAKRLEQDVLDWGLSKLAKPPRSGLWSRLAPWTVGWFFLLIPLAVLVIWGVVTVFSVFSPDP